MLPGIACKAQSYWQAASKILQASNPETPRLCKELQFALALQAGCAQVLHIKHHDAAQGLHCLAQNKCED
jgi:hypothetical protein